MTSTRRDGGWARGRAAAQARHGIDRSPVDELAEVVGQLGEQLDELKDQNSGDDSDVKKKKTKTPAKGRIPPGRPRRKTSSGSTAWERGAELARKRHGITDTTDGDDS